jgi:hypothetical protein
MLMVVLDRNFSNLVEPGWSLSQEIGYVVDGGCDERDTLK